jgi:hypothetical protein
MEIVIYSILVLFLAAAYQDYKKREVSDVITALAWGCAAFVFDLQYFVLFFVGTWLVAVIFEKLKKPLMAFGDVLWFGVFASLVNYFGQNGIVFSLIAILVAQLYLWYQLVWNKKAKEEVNGSPFVMVMLAMLVVAVISKAFFY